MSYEQLTLTVSGLLALIGIAVPCFGLYFNAKNSHRTNLKDVESDAKEKATINVKLDAIASTLADIKNEQSASRGEIQRLSERIVIVEQSVKSAHKRIDEMGN